MAHYSHLSGCFCIFTLNFWEVEGSYKWYLVHTVDTEFSVTNFFCLHFSEHAYYVRHFGQNICGYFLQYMWIILTLMNNLGVPI